MLLPVESTMRPSAFEMARAIVLLPFPLNRRLPLPAAVLILLSAAVTLRIRWLPLSEISLADIAGPSSPANPFVPFLATVVTTSLGQSCGFGGFLGKTSGGRARL